MDRPKHIILTQLAERMKCFELEARKILSLNDDESVERVYSFSQTRNTVIGLSIEQSQLFNQSIRCIENKIYKAAHVMSWAAFIDFLEKKITENGFELLHKARPGWSKYDSTTELRENVVEFQLIEAARILKILHKQEEKILKGLLAKRNECAHPSDYSPGMNETLGYVDELLKRISTIQARRCFFSDKK